ncbi:EGF-like calcium-binding protein [Tanacetum coccineum]
MTDMKFVVLIWAVFQMFSFTSSDTNSTTESHTLVNSKNIAKPGCNSRCGDLIVPYPFGVGDNSECYINEGFRIYCNTSVNPPKASIFEDSYTSVKVISDSTLRTTNVVASRCYSQDGTIYNGLSVFMNYTNFPYTFSKVNKYTVIGCYDSGLLTAVRKSRNVSTTGCMVFCSTPEQVVTGNGCCQSSMPKDLISYSTLLRSMQDSGDNVSYIRSFDPCAYAFIGEENVFKFNGLTDLSATSFKKRIEATVPIVLEWAIGNLNCSVAEATDGYLCQSNSMCVNSTREIGGFRCVCKEGYEENPYLAPGCQGTIKCLVDDDDCGGMNPSSSQEAKQGEGNGKNDVHTSVPSSSYYKPYIAVISSSNGSSPVTSGSLNTTPLAEKINKIEKQMLDGKLIVVDDDGKPLKKVDCDPVKSDSKSEVEVAYDETKRLSGWKSKTLSFGGHLTLTKSVLGSLGIYYFSTFKAPVTIINKLESICRNFFWGGNSDDGKIAWVTWEKVLAPHDQGGLNIRSLKIFNQADLLENASIGRFAVGSSSLYKSVSHWVSLPVGLKEDLTHGWCPTLCSTFPRLFRIEEDTTVLLPTRFNLDRSGIDLHSTCCPVCDEDIETEEHLFSSCFITIDTWAKVLVWWNIPNMTISSLMYAVNLADRVAIPTNHRVAFDVVVQTTLWILWRFQNETCFSSKRPSKQFILSDIKLSSFNSISCRLRKVHLNWIHWFDNPCSSLCM